MLDASKQEARDAVSAAQALEEEMKHRRQADQDALNGEVGVVKSQLNEVLQERSELKVALSRAEDELEGARSDNADLQSDVDKLRQETATLGATTATLTSQVASLKSERDNLKSVADMSEARSIEVQNNSASLAEVRKELSAVQQEADTLRTQNMEAMMQVADLQAEQDKLRRAAAGGQEAAESSKVLRASEQRVTELEQRNQQMADEIDALVKECDDLRDHVDQSANSSAMPSAAALQEKLTEVTRERDELQESLAQNGAKERTGSLDRSDRSYANTLRDDFSEIRETLNCGHNEDVAVAVRYLQNDYADLIDDHDHLKLAAAGYEAEIEALMHERDEWMEKAQSCTDATPGTSPETSRSTAGPSGGENLQETCDDLQRQLQALVRDRDLWRETAESAERRNPGRGMERRPSFGSVGSHMSDNSAQQMLLIQAKEYREKRDGKNKSSWGFSRRAASKNDDPEDIDEDMPDREELIDKLLDTNSSYKEAIKKLKKDIVALNTSLKEDAYSSKKKIDELTHEMSAHELKVMLLEQEIERLQDEAKKSSSGSAQQNSSSDEVERKLKQTEQQKSEVEKELRSLKDAYFKLKQEYETETAAKTSEIEHLKTLQKDFEAKADALENMMDAINQENETLREIAQKNANFSIDSELGKQLAQDDKDVKIAQLNHALIDLRMQGHQQLKDEVDRLQNEKRQTQEAMQQHFAVVEEETNTLVEDLETKLEAREMTIKQLEQMLDMIQASG